MSEVIYLPVEEYWAETMEIAKRQITQAERALATFALRRSGQMELPFGESETETNPDQYPPLLA